MCHLDTFSLFLSPHRYVSPGDAVHLCRGVRADVQVRQRLALPYNVLLSHTTSVSHPYLTLSLSCYLLSLSFIFPPLTFPPHISLHLFHLLLILYFLCSSSPLFISLILSTYSSASLPPFLLIPHVLPFFPFNLPSSSS